MNENNIQPNYFDRSGDFYPLVMSYIVSLHGFMELTSRAVIDISKEIVLKDPDILSQSEKENELYLSKFINAEKTPLLKDLSLGSNIDTFRVEIDIDEIATELFNNNRYLLENGLGTYASRMLLISAYELKKKVKDFLDSKNIVYEDLGPMAFIQDDDYPDYAKKVALRVALVNREDLGILICDTGIGMDIAANKFKNVRAALCTDVFMAKRAKEHNNANVLVLASEIGEDQNQIVDAFLTSKFTTESRHIRRLEQIKKIEGF
jgi:ribose 5-phosphate isomerase B